MLLNLNHLKSSTLSPRRRFPAADRLMVSQPAISSSFGHWSAGRHAAVRPASTRRAADAGQGNLADYARR
jgi:hypothetical protein